MRNWSKALHITKQAKLASQGRLPLAAKPLATLTRFDSAMPTLKKPLRKPPREMFGACRIVHIAIQNNDVRITLAELG
jgi:hypothetical protein